MTASRLDADLRLAEALAAEQAAYRVARRIVFDVLPTGPIDHTRLTPDQARVLQEHRQVERESERSRALWHEDQVCVLPDLGRRS